MFFCIKILVNFLLTAVMNNDTITFVKLRKDITKWIYTFPTITKNFAV